MSREGLTPALPHYGMTAVNTTTFTWPAVLLQTGQSGLNYLLKMLERRDVNML
jgi:hypothetical protein